MTHHTSPAGPSPAPRVCPCGSPLVPVTPEPTGYQFDNALWVGFFGGYGMFVDNIDEDQHPRVLAGADHEAVICHDCAHRLCEAVPWIAALLDPHRSHSHTPTYLAENPTHRGWDTDPRTGDTGQPSGD